MQTQRLLAFFLALIVAPFAWSQLETRSLDSLTGVGQSQPTPLPLAEAFPYHVSEVSPGRLQVTWNLAMGHYLYRHAFKFSLQQAGETLEVEFQLPDGIKKTDQFFGDIEAFYGNVSAELELPTVPGPEASLIIEYQGCADWGFCYPPQRASFLLNP